MQYRIKITENKLIAFFDTIFRTASNAHSQRPRIKAYEDWLSSDELR